LKNLSFMTSVLVWKFCTMTTQFCLTSWSISTSIKNFCATASSASGGHSENQSIVVQLTIDGKSLILFLKEAPIGEKQITIWRLVLHLSRKYANSSCGEPFGHLSSCLAGPLTNSIASAFSSAGKMFGTSPVLRILLMSSKKPSSLIWLSVKMKEVGFPLEATYLMSSLMSSLHSIIL